jgi:hypothetical protein
MLLIAVIYLIFSDLHSRRYFTRGNSADLISEENQWPKVAEHPYIRFEAVTSSSGLGLQVGILF